MKYLVMECHPAYAVVLSEDGRFLKAANLHYEVGQSVTEIIQLHLPQTQPVKKKRVWPKTLGTLAACMAIAFGSLFYMNMTPCASVYMSINPEVRIDVNRKDKVLQVEGINEDGADLVAGYSHKGKELDLVMDELVDLAIDQGYLHEGGAITLSLDGDESWTASHGDHLNQHLNAHLAEKITVTIDVGQKRKVQPEAQVTAPARPIVIPVAPDSYGESDYGKVRNDDDRDQEDDRDEDDQETDYETPRKKNNETITTSKSDDGSDYDKDVKKTDPKPEEKKDGETDYDLPEKDDDAQSDYEERDEEEDSSDYEK